MVHKVEDEENIQKIPSTLGSGSEVEEKTAHQDVRNSEKEEEPSSLNINTADLPPHIVIGMPALSPTMVRKIRLKHEPTSLIFFFTAKAYICFFIFSYTEPG